MSISNIKKAYIDNIKSLSENYKDISEIIVFGSTVEPDRCKESSDIDIAIIFNKNKSSIIKSKSYDTFLRKIYSYDLNQDYDILEFNSREEIESQGPLGKEILKNGITIFKRDVQWLYVKSSS